MHDVYTIALGAGIVAGFYLAVSFLINPKIALLFYVLIMPALQPLMDITIAIPGSTGTVALGGPLQAIILMAALWSVAQSGIRSLRTPVVFIFIILWLIMGLSIAESPDRVRAIKEWGRIGSYVFMFILAGLAFKNDADIKKFVTLLLLSLIVPLSLAEYQIFTHSGVISKLERISRIVGSFGNPNEFAMYISFPLLLCLTIALDREASVYKRLFFACCVLLLVFPLFYTYSRSCWFGVLSGALLISFKRNRSLIFVIPVLVFLSLTFVSLKTIRLGEFETGRLTFSGRIQGWKQVLPHVWDHPIIGRGLTSFADFTTESDHVRLLLETGFLGWLTFLCLVWFLYRAVNGTYKSLEPGIAKNFALAYLAFFMCMLLVSFAKTNVIFQYYVWIPAGIVLSKNIAGKTPPKHVSIGEQKRKKNMLQRFMVNAYVRDCRIHI